MHKVWVVEKWRKEANWVRQLLEEHQLGRWRKDKRQKIPKDKGHHLHNSTLRWLKYKSHHCAERRKRRQLVVVEEASALCPCDSNPLTQAVSPTCSLWKNSDTSYYATTHSLLSMSTQVSCSASLTRIWWERVWSQPWLKSLDLARLRTISSFRQDRQFRTHSDSSTSRATSPSIMHSNFTCHV